MKLIKSFLAAAVAGVMSMGACASKPATVAQEQTPTDMKALVVYFTHSGNTELAAREVASATGAKMIRLMPEKPYTAEDVDWVNEQSRCTREHLDQSLRPALRPIGVDIDDYDTLFIGFPIWWHEEPAIIRTFLDTYRDQLKGKTLYPFCTSYESPMSEADATLRKGYPDLNWKQGLRLPASEGQIRRWIGQ